MDGSVNSRTQRRRGQRLGSAAARLLGLRFRIHPGAWMSVSCECCVLSGRGHCDGLPAECGVSECDRKTSTVWMPWPTGGFCTKGGKKPSVNLIEGFHLLLKRELKKFSYKSTINFRTHKSLYGRFKSAQRIHSPNYLKALSSLYVVQVTLQDSWYITISDEKIYLIMIYAQTEQWIHVVFCSLFARAMSVSSRS
jgi:hypothetical protein